MSGSSSLLCLSTGQWNATVPECMCKSYCFCIKATFINNLFLNTVIQMQNAFRFPTINPKD